MMQEQLRPLSLHTSGTGGDVSDEQERDLFQVQHSGWGGVQKKDEYIFTPQEPYTLN